MSLFYALVKGFKTDENVIEERERSFDLEVMGGTSAACRFIIEVPYPFCWEGFEEEASAAAHAIIFSQVRR